MSAILHQALMAAYSTAAAASNTMLLLHFDGANGSTAFTDSGPNAFAFTPNGDAQISTAQSKFGGASGLFDGSGDFLRCDPFSAVNIGTGDFTIECFIYKTAGLTTTANIVAFDETASSTRWGFYWRGSGSRLAIFNTPQSAVLVGNTSLALNTWYHIAFVRDSGQYRIYLNGVLDGTATPTARALPSSNLFIGQSSSNSEYWPGHIDELRISSAALYTENFTPPTAPFPDA
jgi:hypothetical protein